MDLILDQITVEFGDRYQGTCRSFWCQIVSSEPGGESNFPLASGELVHTKVPIWLDFRGPVPAKCQVLLNTKIPPANWRNFKVEITKTFYRPKYLFWRWQNLGISQITKTLSRQHRMIRYWQDDLTGNLNYNFPDLKITLSYHFQENLALTDLDELIYPLDLMDRNRFVDLFKKCSQLYLIKEEIDHLGVNLVYSREKSPI